MTKTVIRHQKLIAKVSELESMLLEHDPEALWNLDAVDCTAMQQLYAELGKVDSEYHSDIVYIGMKIAVLKLVATLKCMPDLTYSMDGRKQMEALLHRVGVNPYER